MLSLRFNGCAVSVPVFARAQDGEWPALKAVTSNAPADVLRALLDAGADPAKRSGAGSATLAHYAAKAGDPEKLRLLVSMCPTLLNALAAGPEGEGTPLLWAMRHGGPLVWGEDQDDIESGGDIRVYECARVLLEAGADAPSLVASESSRTIPILEAAIRGRERTLRLFLSGVGSGIPPSQPGSHLTAPAEEAEDGYHPRLTEMLGYLLFLACAWGRHGCVRALLEARADPKYAQMVPSDAVGPDDDQDEMARS